MRPTTGRWCLALVGLAGPLNAQQATISPALQRLTDEDTTVAVWMFARPGFSPRDLEVIVSALGGVTRRRSRWLNAISANLSSGLLREAARDAAVRHMQPVARFRGRPEGETPDREAAPLALGRAAADTVYGPSAMPMRILNLFPLLEMGLRGAGVRVAFLDTGFETELPAFQNANVIGQFDFVFNDSIVRNEPDDHPNASRHGTGTWSLLAAEAPGEVMGIAPDAEYLLAKTEDVRSETRVEEDNFVAAMEWADSLGAHIISISLGYLQFDDGFSYRPDELNGDVAVTTVAADIAAQRGILVVVSAGNAGDQPGSIVTPADADSIIAVGAVDSLGAIAGFSGRGPTADGRIKPDLTAPGVAVYRIDPGTATGFARSAGTSFSAPLIAGTAVLLRNLHPSMSPIDLRTALMASGSNRVTPNSALGWGTPDGFASATFPRGLVIVQPSSTSLTSVTPAFSWRAFNVPPFGDPVTFRFRLATDPGFSNLVMDTTTTAEGVGPLAPARPNATLFVDLGATAANGATLSATTAEPFRVPAWVELTTLNGVSGEISRDLRPTFTWSSPDVAVPPGPWAYDLRVAQDRTGVVEIEALDVTGTSYTPDRDLSLNTPYRWSVTAKIAGDTATTESAGTFIIVDDDVPSITLLLQNFPNPFPNPSVGRSTTCVWFDLATSGTVTLEILDLRGHLVRTLVPGNGLGPDLEAARYGRPGPMQGGACDPRLEWDGTADDGRRVPRGIYLVKLRTPDGVQFKRIVYLGTNR